MKHFSSYADKKPAILIIHEDSIPPGMTVKDIADLFDKSEPIPYTGDIMPNLFEVPKEAIRKLTGETANL
jgi:hypothetical protein